MEQSMAEAFGPDVTRAATTTQAWVVVYLDPDLDTPQAKRSLVMDNRDALALLATYVAALPEEDRYVVLRILLDATYRRSALG